MRTGPLAALSVVATLTLTLSLAGCGSSSSRTARDPVVDPSSQVTADPTAMPTAIPAAIPAAPGTVRVAGTGLATILDDGHGAELCLGAIAASLPPQCGGPHLTNWDWSQHDGTYQDRVGVRWGDYGVTGRYDGTSFTVVGAIPSATYDPGPFTPLELPGTPCPPPDGGWHVVDPAGTDQHTLDTALRVARGLPGYAQEWVDQSINPTDASAAPEGTNDPTRLILDVSVTEDLPGAEQALRAVWGGALCVSRADHTEADLRRIQRELTGLAGLESTSYGPEGVSAEVVYDDGSLQGWADATYGVGTVTITSALVKTG